MFPFWLGAAAAAAEGLAAGVLAVGDVGGAAAAGCLAVGLDVVAVLLALRFRLGAALLADDADSASMKSELSYTCTVAATQHQGIEHE